MNQYVNVFIKTKYSKIDILYTYSLPTAYEHSVEEGMRVLVPFGKGNKARQALVVEKVEVAPKGGHLIKPIIQPIDDFPIISEELTKLALWMREKYLLPYNQAFAPLLPPGDYKEVNSHYCIINSKYKGQNSTEIQILEQINEKKALRDIKGYNTSFFKQNLKSLVERSVIVEEVELTTRIGKKYLKAVKLSHNYKQEIDKLSLSAKQKEVIEFLQEREQAYVKDLLSQLNISDSPIKTLEKNKVLVTYSVEYIRNPKIEDTIYKKHLLTAEQDEALNKIISSKKTTVLLHGLTGSGKTEVYLQIAEKIIKEGGQIIILVPEISLTPQMIERVSGRFGSSISILHSRLSQGERFDQWMKIKNGQVKIVVGARSAVFAPLMNLKLIIIDEEHEKSYDYNDHVKYNTMEVAIKRAKQNKAKVLLGSATPSVESYYNALNGKYDLVNLSKRINESFPKISIVDMRKELFNGNTSIFSRKLIAQIEEILERKEQAILFINRRGFSNFVSCRACGYVIKCTNCDISMTYHKNMDHLRCHYCGKTEKTPHICPVCGSKYIKYFGSGTQRVEEEVLKLFPNAKVLRMDSDTTSAKGSHGEYFNKMKNGEADILIGTQMLAKGLDFENVTLVGVIAADLSLYISDFRAQENTFQLLTQVSGRSGRGSKSGCAIIQTYNPENYSIIDAANNQYESFYKKEIEVRKTFSYPPFYKLYTINISSEDQSLLRDKAIQLYNNFMQELNNTKIQLSRLITAPKINKFYKFKVQIKCNEEDEFMLKESIKRVYINSDIVKNSNVLVSIEIN